ncbi:hypothetical protein R3P38DRAFT_1765578 [Favolaschia claudopus]|uniref:DUF6534 domain-containing protein n=1 Tax=Favolaschia claudopus TaxID=2862362 RepID=A0AAW0DH12_9AGAR
MDPSVSSDIPLGVPSGLDIAQLAAPELITCLAEWSLFSVLTIQLYIYYQAFPNDRRSTKSLVYFIYIIHLVEIILVSIDAYKTFASGFGRLSALASFGVSAIWREIMPALVSFIVQSFYAYRLYLLSRSYIIPSVIVFASLAMSVCGFITVVFVLEAGDVSLLGSKRISIFGGIWLGGSALIDIVNAGCMTYYFATSNSVFRQTQALVSKLIRLTIETGTLTALVALTTLILFFAFPRNIYYTTPVSVMPFIYANTMYMVFNARVQIVGGRGANTSSTLTGAVGSGAGYTRETTGMMPATSLTRPSHMVSITREVFSRADDLDYDTNSVEMKTLRGRLNDIQGGENDLIGYAI